MTIDLNQPQVTAAIVGGSVAAVVSLIVAVVNQLSLRSMHKQKLAVDRDLAERKVNADITLAKRKLALDQGLVIWRRRYELAEQMLATGYEAKDILDWVRAPVLMSGEGSTRETADNEGDKLRERRNAYFVPIERLTREAKVFATLQTLKYAAATHFGADAIKPLGSIAEIHNQITSASGICIQIARDEVDHPAEQSIAPLREVLGWGKRPDQLDKKLSDAIAQMETTCKPVLSEQLPLTRELPPPRI